MDLLFLGTTGYHPNARRHTACLMIPEIGLILDAGTGMFRARQHLQTQQLDIFLTHAHLDHCMGLTFLFDVLYEQDVKETRVYAEQEKIDAMNEHLFSELLFPVKPPFEFHPLTETNYKLDGGCQLSHFPLAHPGGSVGYRLDFPRFSMAYVTDTTAREDADYIKKIRGVDLLVHECYFPDGWEDRAELTGHSCVTPVAQVARAAEVGQMVMVHVNPLSDKEDPIGIENAQKVFKNVSIAHDEMVFSFDP